MDLQEKLKITLTKSASILPASVGQHLLTLVTPQALSTMAGIVVIWAGAHFFGIGEIADVILLIVGWTAVGGVAVEAGKKLYDFAIKTYSAKTESDLDAAAQDFADAITLLGVDAVLALLLRKKPTDTFRTTKGGVRIPRYSHEVASRMSLPRNLAPGWRYRPKIIFTKRNEVRQGATNIAGDIRVGRNFYSNTMTAAQAREEMLVTLYHEQVHQFIAPKFYIFREFRAFMRQSGYLKSYLLRYLEEVLAETVAQMRVRGMSMEYVIQGLKFPIVNTEYQITYSLLRAEAAGILLGPVVVGGMVYNVFYGLAK
ncbi:hypothetical protein RJ498_001184 [Pluralibacter gergoviae]